MGSIQRFEDIVAWQKARVFTAKIYNLFANLKDYSFKDQVYRASVSITNNIAEGFERSSNAEFAKFLFIAKGSCGEVRSMLYLALDLGYLSTNDVEILLEEALEISKMISGLIKHLRSS
ncbi:MAG: four helix bundle protein [Prevotellaceae bacterium]|jgi:four helix bundle protein|nr:four helix bundle protein [Prevotellaceae bacterium]